MYVPFPFFNIYIAFAIILVIYSMMLKNKLEEFEEKFTLHCIKFQTENEYSMLELDSYVHFMTSGTHGDTDIFLRDGKAFLWRKSDGHSEIIKKENVESYLKYLEDSYNSKIEDNQYNGKRYYEWLETDKKMEEMFNRFD